MTITQLMKYRLLPNLHHGNLKTLLHYSLALWFLTIATLSHAQDNVSIGNPWVKATHPGQNVSAGYMTLTSANDVTLLKITSDISNSVEIHSMKMENGVMKMRMLPKLELLAGKPYKLEPSGFHLMLFDLKKPLTDAQTVSFELTFKNKQNVEFKQNVKAIVQDGDSKSNNHNDPEHHHNH